MTPTIKTEEEWSRRHFPSWNSVKKSSPFLCYVGYGRCTGCWQNKNSLRKKFGKPQRVNAAAPHGGKKLLKRAKNKLDFSEKGSANWHNSFSFPTIAWASYSKFVKLLQPWVKPVNFTNFEILFLVGFYHLAHQYFTRHRYC